MQFPTISADPAHTKDMQQCADWLKEYLESCGLLVELWQTEKHPIVFASSLSSNVNAPTLLLYHHYDVQPVDPLEDWHSPPFQPTVKEGSVYARGAQDNKGQCFPCRETEICPGVAT